jgi:4-hydroxy-tetrahydrodipicolinate synthase
LITPFDPSGEVDFAALKRLVLHYAGCGIAGLVVCGSTGEAAALDDDEQQAVLEAVAQAAPGLPLVMGLSGYHLGKMMQRVHTLSRHHAVKGLLLPAPHYIRPAQTGLLDWFTRLAEASAVPFIIYDIPYRTGVKLELATLLTLAAHPNIRAIKDCGGDAAKTRALIADGRLQLLCGEDANILSTLAQGGHGAIAAAAHLHTQRFVKVTEFARSGDMASAQALWEPLLPLVQALFEEPNPGPLKALLAHQRWIHNELRSPMTRASEALAERLVALHAAVEEVATSVSG